MNVIRILHFLTVTSLAGACFITGLCAFGKSGYGTADLGSSPSAAAPFGQNGNSPTRLAARENEQDSPLVHAAKEFSRYLNPPAPAKRGPENPVPEKAIQSVAKAEPQIVPESSTPKFELRGISYHRSRPEDSLALIWEPGAGNRWVRQGDQVGHVFIEQVSGSSIRCRDTNNTYEVAYAPSQVPPAKAQEHVALAKAEPPTRLPSSAVAGSTPVAQKARPIMPRRVTTVPTSYAAVGYRETVVK